MVLSGKQCSLGVSIDNCDIILLLNNSMGFDMIYQMMFRCMTEGKNNYNDKLAIFHSPDNRSDKKHILNKSKKENNE